MSTDLLQLVRFLLCILFKLFCWIPTFFVSGKRGPALQMFDRAKHSTDSNPVYECTIGPEGCHHGDDCHYTVGVYCSCYGDSCLRHYDRKTSSGNNRKYATQQYGGGWAWHGCNWQTWGSYCNCYNNNKSRKQIWPIIWKNCELYVILNL